MRQDLVLRGIGLRRLGLLDVHSRQDWRQSSSKLATIRDRQLHQISLKGYKLLA